MPTRRPPDGDTPPLDGDPSVLTPSDGHCSGRYASNWNAFSVIISPVNPFTNDITFMFNLTGCEYTFKVVLYNIHVTNLAAFVWRKLYFKIFVKVSATFTRQFMIITSQR